MIKGIPQDVLHVIKGIPQDVLHVIKGIPQDVLHVIKGEITTRGFPKMYFT